MHLSHTPSGAMRVRNPHGDLIRTIECPRAALLQELALTFPSMKGHPDLNPLDIHGLVTPREQQTESVIQTIRFLLMVWCDDSQTPLGRFDVLSAMAVWDHAHKQAFAQWVEDPFVIPPLAQAVS